MCFATAALIAGGIGAATTAVGTVEQGQATANAASYSAQVAANNAKIAGQNADYASAAGEQQAGTKSLQGAATGGKIKAAQAANNVDVNTGSTVDVQASQREVSKLDTETVLNNAELQAYGYRTQQTNFQAESELDKLKAEQAPIGADLGAAGGFLSSASALSSKYSQIGPKVS